MVSSAGKYIIKGEPLKLSLREGERAEVLFYLLPGEDVSVNVEADLLGEGAELNIRGIYLCDGADKVSVRTEVRHLVPGTKSSQLVCGAAGGDSRASFYGLVVVAEDACRTEAMQTNRNILLSDRARIETRPQLEIYADDVQCSHGATVGRLSEDELFYMRSRGIPEEEARTLQILSFLAPALEGLPDKEAILEKVEDKLRKMA